MLRPNMPLFNVSKQAQARNERLLTYGLYVPLIVLLVGGFALAVAYALGAHAAGFLFG